MLEAPASIALSSSWRRAPAQLMMTWEDIMCLQMGGEDTNEQRYLWDVYVPGYSIAERVNSLRTSLSHLDLIVFVYRHLWNYYEKVITGKARRKIQPTSIFEVASKLDCRLTVTRCRQTFYYRNQSRRFFCSNFSVFFLHVFRRAETITTIYARKSYLIGGESHR